MVLPWQVLHKVDAEKFSLAVCNGGANEGAEEYHLTVPDRRRGGGLLRSNSFVLHEIPAAHVQDSALWFLLLRPSVFPSQASAVARVSAALVGAKATAVVGLDAKKAWEMPGLLYERILPYLNARPLLRNARYRIHAAPLSIHVAVWG